jgi:hypothetical protein
MDQKIEQATEALSRHGWEALRTGERRGRVKALQPPPIGSILTLHVDDNRGRGRIDHGRGRFTNRRWRNEASCYDYTNLRQFQPGPSTSFCNSRRAISGAMAMYKRAAAHRAT